MAFIIFLAFSLIIQAAYGELVCEELPSGMCAFAIASSGNRCLLETPASGGPNIGLQCRTSDVRVNSLKEYIESDECVKACGVDRNVVGISSDSLLQPKFMAKLCSSECYDNCPNIAELYFNLALAEGAFLPAVCEAQKTGGYRRQMAQLLSSGTAHSAALGAAPGPSSSMAFADGPTSDSYSAAAPPVAAVEP